MPVLANKTPDFAAPQITSAYKQTSPMFKKPGHMTRVSSLNIAPFLPQINPERKLKGKTYQEISYKKGFSQNELIQDFGIKKTKKYKLLKNAFPKDQNSIIEDSSLISSYRNSSIISEATHKIEPSPKEHHKRRQSRKETVKLFKISVIPPFMAEIENEEDKVVKLEKIPSKLTLPLEDCEDTIMQDDIVGDLENTYSINYELSHELSLYDLDLHHSQELLTKEIEMLKWKMNEEVSPICRDGRLNEKNLNWGDVTQKVQRQRSQQN